MSPPPPVTQRLGFFLSSACVVWDLGWKLLECRVWELGFGVKGRRVWESKI